MFAVSSFYALGFCSCPLLLLLHDQDSFLKVVSGEFLDIIVTASMVFLVLDTVVVNVVAAVDVRVAPCSRSSDVQGSHLLLFE